MVVSISDCMCATHMSLSQGLNSVDAWYQVSFLYHVFVPLSQVTEI